MASIYEVYCRGYQKAYRVASFFISWREPDVIKGEDSLKELPRHLKERDVSNLLIVTDKNVVGLKLMDQLLSELDRHNINYSVYDRTVPNPTIQNIEEAVKLYDENQSDAIVGFGGGSPIDCAKGVAAKIARPKKDLSKMKGQLKVRRKTPLIIAVPTTAGTGSEATLAAVVSNPDTKEKYAINDSVLFPDLAFLDPKLTIGLPPFLTAITGVDTLTHAVEAYIGKSNTSLTRRYAKLATSLVANNLIESYQNGYNIKARENMLQAAYYGGAAFTRAYVGNIHAIAHTLSAFYNVPHGLANAVLLPVVLEYYEDTVHQPLADLADTIKLKEGNHTTSEKAQAFIEFVKDLNRQMDIPQKIDEIQDEDIPLMVDRAFDEANPLYPVPKIFTKEDFTKIYKLIQK